MGKAIEDGRLLAIGDVHGCARALHTLLEDVDPRSGDVVVFLGDLVDRGPDSRAVLDQVQALREVCTVVLVLGNHEEMMLTGLREGPQPEWLVWGGRETVSSYGGDLGGVPASHRQLLESGVDFFETPSVICVHANLEPSVALVDQQPEWLRWMHLTGDERPHHSNRRIVCGHTPQRHGLPLLRSGWLCIDTMCWAGGFLTCVDLKSDEVWQTQESGVVRSGLTLSELV